MLIAVVVGGVPLVVYEPPFGDEAEHELESNDQPLGMGVSLTV